MYEEIGRRELDAVADLFGIKRHREIISQVTQAVARWPEFADRAGLESTIAERIGADHRLASFG
jgi:serine/threonine-protein kinase HipA